jgi:hypothetical protein
MNADKLCVFNRRLSAFIGGWTISSVFQHPARVVSMSESRMVVLPGPRIGPVFPPPENLTGDQFAAFMDAQE